MIGNPLAQLRPHILKDAEPLSRGCQHERIERVFPQQRVGRHRVRSTFPGLQTAVRAAVREPGPRIENVPSYDRIYRQNIWVETILCRRVIDDLGIGHWFPSSRRRLTRNLRDIRIYLCRTWFLCGRNTGPVSR
ncbi:Uncharacterised protein [Mycobacteroides abscessus subsp. abscessus]|nr:Uncharacterised protein [Mycobacteroides abscessus subsp. abscessus]